VDFDLARAQALARRVHPGQRQLVVSSRSGDGMAEWQQWLAARRASVAAVQRVS
jgi:hydrogenase nickel incorporation protein HypB